MAYIGNEVIQSRFISVEYTATAAQTTFPASGALPETAVNQAAAIVKVNGLVSHTDSYAIGTTLVFDSPGLDAGDKVEIVWLGLAGSVTVPADNTVTNAKIARAGTSGQVLTSAGTGADATWATPAAVSDATPRWLAYVGSSQNLSSNSSVNFAVNTEVFDSDSAFDTGTYTFTVPVGEAGIYYCFGAAYHQGSNASAHQHANTRIYMGSSSFEQEIDSNGNYGKAFSMGAYGIADLAEGDTCYMRGKSIFYSGTVIIGAGLAYSWFGGWRIV